MRKGRAKHQHQKNKINPKSPQMCNNRSVKVAYKNRQSWKISCQIGNYFKKCELFNEFLAIRENISDPQKQHADRKLLYYKRSIFEWPREKQEALSLDLFLHFHKGLHMQTNTFARQVLWSDNRFLIRALAHHLAFLSLLEMFCTVCIMSFKVPIISYHLQFVWYDDSARTLLLCLLGIQYHAQCFNVKRNGVKGYLIAPQITLFYFEYSVLSSLVKHTHTYTYTDSHTHTETHTQTHTHTPQSFSQWCKP